MKEKIFVCILSLSFLFLAACGTTDAETDMLQSQVLSESVESDESTASDVNEEEETQKPMSVTEEEETQMPVSVSEEEDMQSLLSEIEKLPDGYEKIYLQEVMQNKYDTERFYLIYLNDDDIPELVIYDGYYESHTIYTVKDNALFCMVDNFRTIEMTYFEKSGIICSFSRWMGGGDQGGYGRYYYQVTDEKTLTIDDTSSWKYVYNAIHDEHGNYTGEGLTEYYYMGQEISEKEFQKIWTDLGLLEYDDERTLENSFQDKEELKDFLMSELMNRN